jgi:hypothetical protein
VRHVVHVPHVPAISPPQSPLAIASAILSEAHRTWITPASFSERMGPRNVLAENEEWRRDPNRTPREQWRMASVDTPPQRAAAAAARRDHAEFVAFADAARAFRRAEWAATKPDRARKVRTGPSPGF